MMNPELKRWLTDKVNLDSTDPQLNFKECIAVTICGIGTVLFLVLIALAAGA